MNIIVVTNDGVNLSSPFSNEHYYKLFEINRKDLNTNSNRISELVKKTNHNSRSINDTQMDKILTSDKKKTVFITKNLSQQAINRFRKSNVETYITFKKSIDEALFQYYADMWKNVQLYTAD
jgi:hypothetical protein